MPTVTDAPLRGPRQGPCDPSRTRPVTLHAALDEIATAAGPQRVHFPDEHEVVTLAELAGASRRVARDLAGRGVRRGDVVALLAPNAPEFLTTMFGVSRLGGATAPLALPMTADVLDWVGRLGRILDTARPSAVVVSHRIAARLAPALERVPAPVIVTDDPGDPDDPVPDATGSPDTSDTDVPVGPDEPAVVQFTSGSTSDPKGVVLSHANVWHCARAITAAIELGPDDVHGSWLPLFHDMGLFGALTGLFRGIPLHLWSPAGFVRRPARWIAAFAQARATIATMPNFGYDTLLGAVGPEAAAALDLSAWRVAFNGAEAVSASATAAFLDRFAAAGFRPATMTPAYGLAEATLVVTLPPPGRAPVTEHVDRHRLAATGLAVPVPADHPDARALVGLGHAVPGTRVEVVDDAGAIRPDGVVGEIVVAGPSVCRGYLGAERPPGDGLRTGDLGYLRDGELFFTGRRKELITVAGRNVYPADVEEAAREVPGVHRGRAVAFADAGGDRADDPTDGRGDGTEHVVLVAEGPEADGPERDDLVARLRAAVVRAVGPLPLRVLVVAPRTIPRTTSGKLRRLEMRTRIAPEVSS